MLVGGGAECGPSNPLQSLSKRFDQDRGAQQVCPGAARVTGCQCRNGALMYAFAQDVAGPSRSRGPLSGEVCRSIPFIGSPCPMSRFSFRLVLPSVRSCFHLMPLSIFIGLFLRMCCDAD